MKYFKAKLRRGLINAGAFLGISGIGLVINYLGNTIGFFDIATLGIVFVPIGVTGAAIFFWSPFLFPEWYNIQVNSDSSTHEEE